MRSKKSRFWGFCLSFLPGCAEMYMGFMKMGLSLMGLFWGITALAVILNMGPLLFVALIVWFYSFFHARNLAHLPDAAFESLKDEYLFHLSGFESSRMLQQRGFYRIVAAILIVLGAVLCLRAFRNLLSGLLPMALVYWIDDLIYVLPQIVVGVGIILLGCWLIRGKKQELFDEPWEDHSYAGQSSSGSEASYVGQSGPGKEEQEACAAVPARDVTVGEEGDGEHGSKA